jgi:hypothetical protein
MGKHGKQRQVKPQMNADERGFSPSFGRSDVFGATVLIAVILSQKGGGNAAYC